MQYPGCRLSLSARRAWIEIVISAMTGQISVSLSARRAWIEIWNLSNHQTVDLSLSARRAWIEIFTTRTRTPTGCVALRKESVDRNKVLAAVIRRAVRRSPQGERG